MLNDYEFVLRGHSQFTMREFTQCQRRGFNVDIKLASLRNDYAFNDFLQEIQFVPSVLIIETLLLIL